MFFIRNFSLVSLPLLALAGLMGAPGIQAQSQPLSDRASLHQDVLDLPRPVAEDLSTDAPDNSDSMRGIAVTVGTNASLCTYTNLQSAINFSANGDVIHLSSGVSHAGQNYTIDGKSLTIRGGFSDCAATTASGRTVVNINGPGIVFAINYPAGTGDPTRTVNLENLVIRGASGNNGGGVRVSGRPGKLQVNLRNVEIRNNTRTGTGGNGAGMRIRTSADSSGSFGPMVTVDNASQMLNNVAGGDGGAIHASCGHSVASNTLLRMGTTLVLQNEATNGGGLAVSGCKNVFLYNGAEVFLIIPTGGFVLNSATSNGGGLHVSNGAEVTLRATAISGFGDPASAAMLVSNSASGGGAATVTGNGSRLVVEDAHVFGNSATGAGGAFRIISGGDLMVRRSASGKTCAPVTAISGVTRYPPCSVVRNNSTNGNGGAFSLGSASRLDVIRTFVTGNTANNFGPAVYAANLSISSPPGPQVRIEGSLIADNIGNITVDIGSDSDVEIWHSTLAGNGNGALFEISAFADRTARLAIYTSILKHNPAVSLIRINGSQPVTVFGDCVIGNRPRADVPFTAAFHYSNTDPAFVNESAGDYRLATGSPAIDYCDGFNPPQHPDIKGDPRGVAWTGPTLTPPPGSVAGGLFDLGAYETTWEGIFADRFRAL